MVLKKSKLLLLLLPLVVAQWGCNTQTASAPASPVPASARLGVVVFNCETNSPGHLVKTGKGALVHTVIGANVAQFSIYTHFTPATFNSPSVTSQNGTTYNIGFHSIQTNVAGPLTYDVVNFQVPYTDSYTIKMWYIEYGTSAPAGSGNSATCSNPTLSGNNVCYRWYKKVDCLNGFVPSASYNNFSILISDDDPSGFKGNCF
jgi:hypothetical protein